MELNVNAPRWNSGTQECESCENLNYNIADNECVASCPASAPIPVKHVCRTCYQVSWLKPKWTGEKCDYCYDSYWNGEDCVAACPESTPNVYAGVCYSCSDSLYFSPESGKCVSKCPDTLPVPNDDEVCVTCMEKDPNTPVWLPTDNYGNGKRINCGKLRRCTWDGKLCYQYID